MLRLEKQLIRLNGYLVSMKQLLLVLLLVLAGRAYALKPSREYVATPDSIGLPYREVAIDTPDHFRLNSWLIEPQHGPDQHTTVVVAGGDAGNMSYLLYHARMLANAGYRVLLFDYRGFGHSSEFAIEQQRLYYTEFVTDLRAAVRYARRQFPQERTGVFAFSMGTLMATHLAAKEKLDFLVGEGYVADPAALVAALKQTKNKTVTLPAEAARYTRLLPKINCPMLLVAGSQDKSTTVADSTRIVQAARPGQRRELLPFVGGHGGGLVALSSQPEPAFYGDLYAKAIQRFLAKE